MSMPHWQHDISDTLQAKNPKAMSQGSAVRRLTPKECERLQGFPDDYTLISHRGKPAADGPRYKALGNSMAVPVMHWIGERIQIVEALHALSAQDPRP
jgi:DNA (cytosine-5)-methyltransferase 1